MYRQQAARGKVALVSYVISISCYLPLHGCPDPGPGGWKIFICDLGNELRSDWPASNARILTGGFSLKNAKKKDSTSAALHSGNKTKPFSGSPYTLAHQLLTWDTFFPRSNGPKRARGSVPCTLRTMLLIQRKFDGYNKPWFVPSVCSVFASTTPPYTNPSQTNQTTQFVAPIHRLSLPNIIAPPRPPFQKRHDYGQATLVLLITTSGHITLVKLVTAEHTYAGASRKVGDRAGNQESHNQPQPPKGRCTANPRKKKRGMSLLWPSNWA